MGHNKVKWRSRSHNEWMVEVREKDKKMEKGQSARERQKTGRKRESGKRSNRGKHKGVHVESWFWET